MTKSGTREYLRRGVSLVLLTLGFIGFAYWDRGISTALIVTALIFYYFLPRTSRPSDALIYERMPAVVVPDLLGFALTSLFIAFPFWAGATENDYLHQSLLSVHPSAALTWPLSLVFIFILVVAANYASYWVVIEPNGLTVSSSGEKKFLAYGQMVEVTPYRRGIPKWVKVFTPLLILSGKYTAAGGILLTRDTTGMSITMQDTSSINITSEAFEKPFKEILIAMHNHDIPVDAAFRSRFLG